jgi:hypothetical protein
VWLQRVLGATSTLLHLKMMNQVLLLLHVATVCAVCSHAVPESPRRHSTAQAMWHEQRLDADSQPLIRCNQVLPSKPDVIDSATNVDGTSKAPVNVLGTRPGDGAPRDTAQYQDSDAVPASLPSHVPPSSALETEQAVDGNPQDEHGLDGVLIDPLFPT